MKVILHNIRSIHNVGSIFRTADALGIEKIYLCGITPSPIDELGKARKDFHKISLGAEQNVPWEKVKSTTYLIKKFKKKGHKIFTIEQSKESISYFKLKLRKNNLRSSVFVLGNEVKGLPRSVLLLSDKILEIPMKGKKESLNVSIAFAVVIYHFLANYA